MKTIYRYELDDTSGVNRIMMPTSAKILSAGIASESSAGKEKISIWALAETGDNIEERKVIVAGTGANLDEVLTFDRDVRFIGTVIKSNKYAFHIFEVNDKYNI